MQGGDRAEDGTIKAVEFCVGGRRYALPLSAVIETMRPLAVQEISGAPDAVLGIAIIRGVPIVVVDASRLLGAAPVAGGRFMTLRVGSRSIALAVDAVLGVKTLPRAQFHALPPLMSNAASIDALGTVDAELMMLLHAGSLLPEDVLHELDAAMPTS